MEKAPYLVCGMIQNTHGCHGEVRVASYCDSPDILARLTCVYLKKENSYTPLHVQKTARQGECVLMTLEEVDSMEAAEQLKAQMLYAARADIPLKKDAYFWADLVGLPLLDADSEKTLGEVLEMREVGIQQLLAVRVEAGERLIPNVPAFVVRVDTESGVYVRPIPGLLD